mgnify:CR=1 FL=1
MDLLRHHNQLAGPKNLRVAPQAVNVVLGKVRQEGRRRHRLSARGSPLQFRFVVLDPVESRYVVADLGTIRRWHQQAKGLPRAISY